MEALINLTKLIPILALLITIYKTYYDIFSKRYIYDLEQVNKYFSSDKLSNLKKEPEYIKDLACQTVSFLKGHKFQDILYLLENQKINLFDLRDILRLKKMNVLSVDEKTGKLKLNKNYDNEQPFSLKKLFRTKIWFSWLILASYALFLAFVFVIFEKNLSFVKQVILMIILVGLVEFPILNNIEKIKSAKNFKEKYLKKFLTDNQQIILPK